MKKQKRKLSPELEMIIEWEKDNRIAALSTPQTEEGEEQEPHFGRCDISGEYGNVWDVEYLVKYKNGKTNIKKTFNATISHEALVYFYNGID